MKLKYYLRGLGIGIFMTALILTIANHNGNKMSDEEAVSRAIQLGYVKESETLFPDNTTANSESTEDITTEAITTEAVTTTEEVTTEVMTTTEEVTEPITEPVTEPATEPVTEPATEPVTDANPGVVSAIITISSGMYSEAVSQEMQNAGIISDWNSFNNFLCDTGYAERLQTGEHHLNSAMSYEEMANALMR